MYAARVRISRRTRRVAGLSVHALAALALVPAFVWLAPPSRWDQPELFAALLALGVIADFHDVPLPSGIRMDAGMALALIALAVLGPLPALLVELVPMTVGAPAGGAPRAPRAARPRWQPRERRRLRLEDARRRGSTRAVRPAWALGGPP